MAHSNKNVNKNLVMDMCHLAQNAILHTVSETAQVTGLHPMYESEGGRAQECPPDITSTLLCCSYHNFPSFSTSCAGMWHRKESSVRT